MPSITERLRAPGPIPIHPLLFALFPGLSLLGFNIQELYPEQALRSLAVSLALALVLLVVFRVLLKDFSSASILTSLALILFFSYGHVYNWIEDAAIGPIIVGRHRYLLLLWLLVFAVAGVVLYRHRPAASLTQALNLAGLVLVLMPTISLVSFYVRPEGVDNQAVTRIPTVDLQLPEGELPPDIYYIILDGYARSDFMTDAVGYDNRDFIDFLTQSGFYVAEKSRSNHNMTALSLASSLNMTPAQFLGVRMVRGDYPEPFSEPIAHSVVRRALERIGYNTISFRSGYRLTELQDADVYVSPDDRRVRFGFRPNAFEDILLHSTLLKPFLESGALNLSGETSIVGGAGTTQRELILSEYDSLEQLPETDGPDFVFAHIVAMHAPYLFDREGKPIGSSEAFTLLDDESTDPTGLLMYREQAEFITKRTRQMVEAILASYDTPPVIVIQADHGSGAVEGETQRAAILNAILIKESCRENLYPTITPVNTFRIIFNCYFNADLPLAPDDVYRSPWPRYFDYEFIPLPTETP